MVTFWGPKAGYKFIGFGAIAITKPYKFIGCGAIAVTKPYQIIGFGALWGPKRDQPAPGRLLAGPYRPGPDLAPQTEPKHNLAVLRAKIKFKNFRIRAGIGPEPTIPLGK